MVLAAQMIKWSPSACPQSAWRIYGVWLRIRAIPYLNNQMAPQLILSEHYIVKICFYVSFDAASPKINRSGNPDA
jgi:hypothetical protein